MKKKIIACLVVFAFAGLDLAPMSYAQTSVSGPSGSATATVTAQLEFSIKTIKKMDAAAFDPSISPFNQGTVATSFDFGTLQKQNDANGNFLFMRGQFFYYVLMLCSTSGRRYKITESGSQLTGPNGATLDKNSVILAPEYQAKDAFQFGTSSVPQGNLPSGASVGAITSACNTDSLVYQSDGAGLSRIVRAVLAISGPAAGASLPFNFVGGVDLSGTGSGKTDFTSWKPVTSDQGSGAYSSTGTMTFTLTLN